MIILSHSVYVVVNIADVNDNNPVFDQATNVFTIVEGNATAIGTVFGYIQASDIDESNIITYSLRYNFFFTLKKLITCVYMMARIVFVIT